MEVAQDLKIGPYSGYLRKTSVSLRWILSFMDFHKREIMLGLIEIDI